MTAAGVTLHYSTVTYSDNKAWFALTSDGTGWLSVAWPETPGRMVPATAVIYTPDQGPDPVSVYDLTAE